MRLGYRRLTVLLRRNGWRVNAKRIYRLYTEEGLPGRTKHRTKAAGRHRVCCRVGRGDHADGPGHPCITGTPHVSYARFTSPHGRPKPITCRSISQVSFGLHSRGGSKLRLTHIAAGTTTGDRSSGSLRGDSGCRRARQAESTLRGTDRRGMSRTQNNGSKRYRLTTSRVTRKYHRVERNTLRNSKTPLGKNVD